MSVLKLLARGGMVVGALIVLNGCSNEESVGNKYKKINEGNEVDPKKTFPKKVEKTSVQTSRVIARVMNPKVLLKKTLSGVEDLIGKAHFKRREGNAVVLQYKKDFWTQVTDQFLGETNQIPPMYSALKHKGKRLYKIARSGRTVDRSPRKITIYSIDVTNIAKDSIRFTVHCSKGTYIRVLVEDIAKSAGMLAYTSFLRRVRIGQFDQFRMIEFDELKSMFIEHNKSLDEHLIPIEHALFNFQNIELSHTQAKKFLNGQRLHCNLSGSGNIKVFDQDKNLLGIATQVDNSVIAPKRIFHL